MPEYSLGSHFKGKFYWRRTVGGDAPGRVYPNRLWCGKQLRPHSQAFEQNHYSNSNWNTYNTAWHYGARVLYSYHKALSYYPDIRACLGLGIYEQKKHHYSESVKILNLGLVQNPGNGQFNLCLGVSYMNMGKFQNALACFLKVKDSEQTAPYIAECRHQLNRQAVS